ncbi:MAG: AarF/ABC1/UbiB kinase family protein [Myxococcota bacterium]
MSTPHRFRARARHLRRIVGATASAGVRRILRTDVGDDARFGEALVAELDQLKGMAMKVGQILSYLDGILPDETQRALSVLQQGAQPVAFAVIEQVIADELGAPIDVLFDAFDPRPIAAASIGQVHRARRGTQRLAVKVQYPHIRETILSDVKSLRRLAGVAGLATRVDGQAIVDDLAARLDEECDYLAEAGWLERFQDAFSADPRVVIPRAFPERSSLRVLTMEWCDGDDLGTFVAGASPDARQRAGLTLADVAWRSLFVHGAINADPHPGNQRFREDAVVFLDFGCVRVFSPVFLGRWRRMIGALLDNDRTRFEEAVIAMGIVDPMQRYDWDAHWAMERHFYAPYLTKSFTFTREWLEAGVQYTRPENPNLRRMAIPPEWIWLQRLQWGLHAVLIRLGASGDFRSVMDTALYS